MKQRSVVQKIERVFRSMACVQEVDDVFKLIHNKSLYVHS